MAEAETIRNDLAHSAAALRSQPLLVAITLGLGLAPLLLLGISATPAMSALWPLVILVTLVPLLLFETGFVGTQRIWFLRAYRGTSLRNEEIWPLTRAFIRRMFLLGLLTGAFCFVVVVPIMVLGFVKAFQGGGPAAAMPRFYSLAMTGVVLVVDVALTFVVPALAYTTRSVGEAFRLGFRMIGESWPRSALYVLAPGLLATTFAAALPVTVIGLGGLVLLSLVGAVLALWFKGAIAAYYLRLHPETPDDGAAHVT